MPWDDDATRPMGIPLGTLLPRHGADTDPIPRALAGTQPIPLPVGEKPQVRASETCGPCGSAFEVDWVGRTDALTVIREWRSGHRCHPPLAVPDVGVMSAQIERVGFGLD